MYFPKDFSNIDASNGIYKGLAITFNTKILCRIELRPLKSNLI